MAQQRFVPGGVDDDGRVMLVLHPGAPVWMLDEDGHGLRVIITYTTMSVRAELVMRPGLTAEYHWRGPDGARYLIAALYVSDGQAGAARPGDPVPEPPTPVTRH